MKLNGNIINKINNEMKAQGLIELEDSIVLSINEEMQNRFNQTTEIFTDLIRFLSRKSNSNEIDYIEIFDKYRECDEKIEEIYSNDILYEVLETQRDRMICLNNQKARVIAKHLTLGCGASVKEINNFIDIKTKQQIKKFTDVIISDLEKNDKYLLELNSVTFELITNILHRFNEEENDIEEIITTEDIKRYNYIPNYKDLERIALNNGYIYKHSNGSHRRLEHKDTKKCITIPSHNQLGLGISLAIQKQIYINAN